MRYQVLFIELMTQRYQIRKLRPPKNRSMANSFGRSPTGEKLKRDNCIRYTDNLTRRSVGGAKSRYVTEFFAYRVVWGWHFSLQKIDFGAKYDR